MKQVFTATCLAAAFAVGLAAQSTGTSGTAAQDSQTTTAAAGQRGGGPRTITGCLRAGDTAGTYMLTDVVMPGGGRRGGDATGTTAASGTTTSGTTTGSTGTTGAAGTTAGTMAQDRPMTPQSLMLTADSSVDLKAHVGHKIEVTGTMAGGGRRPGDAAGTATGTATGTTTGGTGTGGTATATGTGTTGAGATTGSGQGMGRGPRSMTVTSVRMISESCN
jgi:hypothetical protein